MSGSGAKPKSGGPKPVDSRDVWDKIGDVVQHPIGAGMIGVLAGQGLGRLAGRKLRRRANDLHTEARKLMDTKRSLDHIDQDIQKELHWHKPGVASDTTKLNELTRELDDYYSTVERARNDYTWPAMKLENKADRLSRAGRWAGAGAGSVIGNEVSKHKK